MMEAALHIAAEAGRRALEATEEAIKEGAISFPEEIGAGAEALPGEIGDDVPIDVFYKTPEGTSPDGKVKYIDKSQGGPVIRMDENPRQPFPIHNPEQLQRERLEPVTIHGGAAPGDDIQENNIEISKTILEKIEQDISTPDGIKAMIDRHPEKAKQWKEALDSINVLNNPDATPTEIRSAQAKISALKGQLLETAAKDALLDCGFSVEPTQRLVDGESGGTKPDIIAKNNTDKTIDVFGKSIQPGESLSVECKCGSTAYITNQLNNHIPNQLSGQIGEKVLMTTNDVKDTPPGLAEDVCGKYGATLVVPDISVSDVENAMKALASSTLLSA